MSATSALPMSSFAGLDHVDPALERGVRAQIADVESMLREAIKSDYPFITETSRHLVEAGGKRFRPLVVLLAARLGDANAPGVVPAAVAIELTHLSTLYHDDVMDEAGLRRGAESANMRWTNTVAILTGDFLFARASEIAADLGTEPTRILARTIAVLCEGQIRETVGPGPGESAVPHYLRVVADKTASLIGTSARLGAMLAGCPPDTVDLVTRFGEQIGMAFQLSDDLLDVEGAPAESGKHPGTDLLEGVRTLPVLYALDSDDPGGERLRTLLRDDLRRSGGLDEALTLLRDDPAMRRARASLRAWADDARATLSPLPPSPARRALEALCHLVVTRTG
jgi:heptaprenyl diphosphate synthase